MGRSGLRWGDQAERSQFPAVPTSVPRAVSIPGMVNMSIYTKLGSSCLCPRLVLHFQSPSRTKPGICTLHFQLKKAPLLILSLRSLWLYEHQTTSLSTVAPPTVPRPPPQSQKPEDSILMVRGEKAHPVPLTRSLERGPSTLGKRKMREINSKQGGEVWEGPRDPHTSLFFPPWN